MSEFDIEAFLDDLWDDDHDPPDQPWEAHTLDRLYEASMLLREHGHEEAADRVYEEYNHVAVEVLANE